MAIIIDQEQKLLTPHTITLHTKNTTYQMAVGAYGQLLHLYYGPRLDGDMRYLLTYYDRGFSGNPYEAECDKTYSMDALPQEYPCFGTGDFRSPAFVLKNADGAVGTADETATNSGGKQAFGGTGCERERLGDAA